MKRAYLITSMAVALAAFSSSAAFAVGSFSRPSAPRITVAPKTTVSPRITPTYRTPTFNTAKPEPIAPPPASVSKPSPMPGYSTAPRPTTVYSAPVYHPVVVQQPAPVIVHQSASNDWWFWMWMMDRDKPAAQPAQAAPQAAPIIIQQPIPKADCVAPAESQDKPE